MRKLATAVKRAPAAEPVHLCFDGFELDEANARLLRDGRPVALAPTPFALLCLLARQPGSLIGKDALLDAVWGHRFVSESVLKTAVSELRSALADDAHRPRYIETVSRRGYRFIGLATGLASRRSAAGGTTGLSAALPTLGIAAETLERRVRSITGRRQEMARLWAAWERSRSGQRTMVWVAGDAGIGKTALIDRFCAELGADVAIARGQCVQCDLGAAEPYLPILEALAGLCRLDDGMRQLLRRVAPAWLARMPWLNESHEGHGVQRELTFGDDQMLIQLGELLDTYTERRPLLLVIEDMHWSDHATVQLMNHIARRRGRARLMWLASFRLVEVVAFDHPLKALRAELRLHGLCDEITLDPFSEQEIASYLAERAPSMAGDDAVVRALHERTGGLPVFVAHVVAELARGATGAPDAGAGPRVERAGLPESLAGIIEHYASRLSPEQLEVLEVAAVCGATFRVTSLAAALASEPGRVSSLCEELVRGHLWLNAAADEPCRPPDSSYTFGHGLVRQWLIERMGPLARTVLEGKLAALRHENVCGTPGVSPELAVHCEPDPADAAFAECGLLLRSKCPVARCEARPQPW